MCVFHHRVFALVCVRCGLRCGIDMLCSLDAILELYSLETLLKLCSDGGIIHINKGVTISVIIVCIIFVIIIKIIHNVGMCGAIPNRNWAVVMVVIELILCAIPYKEGYVKMIGCLCGFVYVCVVTSI